MVWLFWNFRITTNLVYYTLVSVSVNLKVKRQVSTAKSYSTKIRVKRLLASEASEAFRGQSKISNFQYFAKFFQWNQRSLGFKNGDISFHQVVENGQISPMAGWSKREDWSLLLLFAFFAIIDLQQGKTLKNVALDILGKIIGGGVCRITVAFDFWKQKGKQT